MQAPQVGCQPEADSYRLTINVATEDSRLANAAVSTTVNASVPVVAERAMYWPGAPSQWLEAHNSFGVTNLARQWGIADLRVGGPHAFLSYILLANPSASSAQVTVRFGTPAVRWCAPTSSRPTAGSTSTWPETCRSWRMVKAWR